MIIPLISDPSVDDYEVVYTPLEGLEVEEINGV